MFLALKCSHIHQNEREKEKEIPKKDERFNLGTVQYLWQCGTGKNLTTGPAVTFDLQVHGTMCFL